MRDEMKNNDSWTGTLAEDMSTLCQNCGACCAYSHEWPRFSLESDDVLALIPDDFVNAKAQGMKCDGNRCSALEGEVGVATSCRIYDVRPDVCRDCLPGDEACLTARRHFGLRNKDGF